MRPKNSAAILTIGTEVSSGDIANGNCQWLSSRLTSQGFDVRVHMTVPDDRQLMSDALRFCLDRAHIIMITGGLGPTSDDFTRDVVASVCDQALVWHEASWQKITQRLMSLGFKEIPENNKQQCFFPEKATVLTNDAGTADGFKVLCEESVLYVLPGPPKELESLYKAYLHEDFDKIIPADQRTILKIWRCLGQSESKLAALVEDDLADFPHGYRAYPPYVDIKVWVSPSNTTKLRQIEATIESKIQPYVVEVVGEQMLMRLTDGLHKKFDTLYIVDQLTQGALASHFRSIRAGHPLQIIYQMNTSPQENLPSQKTCFVSVDGSMEQGLVEIAVTAFGKTTTQKIQLRYKGSVHAERLRNLASEITLQHLVREFC